MSPDNEQLTPTPFETAPAPEPQQSSSATPGRNWTLPALAALVVLALLVIFWLPRAVQPTQPAATPADSPTAAADSAGQAATPAAKPAQPSGPDATPWSDAQAARLRKEAQDVLQDLLDLQFALEEQGVQQWDAEGFASAAASASAGDELYKQRQYEAAKGEYQQGLALLQALMARAPEVFARQLQLAAAGIEALDASAVATALATAALIEPTSPELAILQQRAQQLPALAELLQAAEQAEQQGDLAAAEQALEDAVKLDPAHQYAAEQRQRVATAHLDQQFNDAMSDGYSALDEGRFEPARQAFRRAGQLQPGSTEAASALQEVAAAQQSSRLGQLQQRSRSAEQAEDWPQAVKAYEQALAIDGDILFAREGLARARERAAMDASLRKIIAEPLRLADVGVARDSEDLLLSAKAIQPRGSKLAAQIEQVQTLLRQAATPVQVTLRSDAETEVIVYKVARLGRFEQKQLTLRPGKYTAVGSRNGFRDVRREIIVRHDQAPAPVVITCTERI